MGNDDVTLSPPGTAVGGRVRELRTAARWSQARLAALMREQGWRWHQMTVSRVETGQQLAAFEEVESLADIFGVPVATFRRGEAA